MTNLNNFLLNSDYPLDKVIYISTGSSSVPDSTSDTISFAHDLPFTPLSVLIWSNTSDFTISNEFRDAEYISNSFTTGAGQYYSCSADATNIIINRYNFSGSAKTLYYRIFCFQPSDASIDSVVPSTEVLGDNFIQNTDYNYMKLAYSGILIRGVNDTFSHDFGYVPRVRVWEQTGTMISSLIAAQEINTDPTGSLGETSGVYIGDNDLVWLNPNTYDKIHYRIYGET